jgi:hypothetical protein
VEGILFVFPFETNEVVIEQGVTEQVIFDHCCSVNANFIFQGLRIKPARNFPKKNGEVYDFGEEDNNGAWEASGRRRGKEAKGESFGFRFFWREIRGSISLGRSSGGCRETNQRRRRGVENRR